MISFTIFFSNRSIFPSTVLNAAKFSFNRSVLYSIALDSSAQHLKHHPQYLDNFNKTAYSALISLI